MKKLSLLLITLAFTINAFSQSYYTRQAGSWTDNNNVWSTTSQMGLACSCTPGNSISGTTTVYIYNNVTSFGALSALTSSGKLVIESGDSAIITTSNLNMSGSSNITVNSGGTLILNGALTMSGSSSITISGKVFVYGNVTNSGSAAVSDNGDLTIHGNVSTSGSAGFSGGGTSYVIGTVTGPNTSMLSVLPSYLSSFANANGTGLVKYQTSPLALIPLQFNNNASTVLTGDGNWTNFSGLSPWQLSGSNLFYNSGNVGIGTSTPTQPLQVNGNILSNGTVFADNLAASNGFSVGAFKIVNGMIDSITSTGGPAGSIQLNAASVTATSGFTAQLINAGTNVNAININGISGTITSPSGNIGFVNSNISTTGTLQAGSFQSTYFKTDSMQVSYIIPQDSLLYLGDPGPPYLNLHYMANQPIGNLATPSPKSYYAYPNSGFSFVNSIANNCPVYLSVGSEYADAELNVTGPCNGNLLFSATNSGLNKDVFTIDKNGNTLISGTMAINTATIPAGYTLAVNGAVIATDVYVQLYNNWPDYVFDKKYKRRSLEELEAYVTNYHHLPDMPSAKDIEGKGSISVSEIATKNTKEIEELTLDLIELNKKVKLLEEENKKLLEEINKNK